MSNIIAVEPGQYTAQIQDLFSEYLYWANGRLSQEFGISLDMPAIKSEGFTFLYSKNLWFFEYKKVDFRSYSSGASNGKGVKVVCSSCAWPGFGSVINLPKFGC